MAYSDTEVEIKLEITKKDFLKVEKLLRTQGKFLSESRQIDTYYNHPSRDFLLPRYPFEWLRIGLRGKKAILNYKHFFPENSEKTTHCDEFETEVASPEKLELLFSALGIRKIVTVDKTRRNYFWKGVFVVSLDSVKSLGTFVEIESEKSFGSVEKTLEKIWEVAGELGISNATENLRGYPFTLMERKGIFPKKKAES